MTTLCPAPTCKLRSESGPFSNQDSGSQAWLRCEGEIDISRSDRLWVDLAGCSATGAAQIILDLRDVTFMDSSGMMVILDANRMMKRRGQRLEVVTRPALHRLFRILHLDEVLTLRPARTA